MGGPVTIDMSRLWRWEAGCTRSPDFLFEVARINGMLSAVWRGSGNFEAGVEKWGGSVGLEVPGLRMGLHFLPRTSAVGKAGAGLFAEAPAA